MVVASKSVVTAPPTLPVIEGLRLMVKKGFRRLPIVRPGDKQLIGILTATDLVNYFGGGRLFRIISEKFKGDYYRALNEHVGDLASANVVSISQESTVNDALTTMVLRGVGSLPIVNHEKQIVGIITERDIVRHFSGKLTTSKAKDLMTSPALTVTPETSLLNGARLMVSRKIRRILVTEHEQLLGIVTTLDVLRYISSKNAFEHLESGRASDILSTRISDFMTRELLTIDPETEVGRAAEIMNTKRIGALPVVSSGNLVGILTERDFFKVLAAE